ncbi:MAG: hypothetical protein SGJ01_15565 [Gemmatimonadota bacterium]|nr:hypothetical protein [Gemmatimonadota bacterium]
MTDDIRIYLNERGVLLPPGTTARDALRLGAPDVLPAAEAGTAVVTDGRGLPVSLDTALQAGAILRAVHSSRRIVDADA